MKRAWVGIAMIVLVVALSIWGLFSANHLLGGLERQLNDVQQTVQNGDYQQAKQQSQQITEDWEGSYRALCTFIPHDKLEQIDQSLATLNLNLEYEEYAQFSTEAARACTQLQHLRDTEFPTLENIL